MLPASFGPCTEEKPKRLIELLEQRCLGQGELAEMLEAGVEIGAAEVTWRQIKVLLGNSHR